MALNLESISKTKRIVAKKVVIVGPGKIGKTTFAAAAPNCVGILTEDGSTNIDTVAFPLATTLDEVYQALGVLITEDHGFENVFLDSLDWCEPLIHKHVCAANGWKDIESPGYGKGYILAAEEWRTLLSGFEALRNAKNMGVFLIAHDKIKRIDDPMTDGYDSHVLKLHDRASALIMEWADVIGYAGYKIVTRQNDAGFNKTETKATTTGARILHLEPHPAHCGGNRFGLKNQALNYSEFSDNIKNSL